MFFVPLQPLTRRWFAIWPNKSEEHIIRLFVKPFRGDFCKWVTVGAKLFFAHFQSITDTPTREMGAPPSTLEP